MPMFIFQACFYRERNKMFRILQNGLLANVLFSSEAVPMLILAACLVVSYLLGSINSALLVSRLVYGEDIRKKGSGNAGLTNTARVYGKKAAALVLLGDILKTAIALLITALFFGFHYYYSFSLNGFLYLSAVACILGHSYPVYFKFKGGKGVLCTAAAVLILAPAVFAVEILIFAIMLQENTKRRYLTRRLERRWTSSMRPQTSPHS